MAITAARGVMLSGIQRMQLSGGTEAPFIISSGIDNSKAFAIFSKMRVNSVRNAIVHTT